MASYPMNNPFRTCEHYDYVSCSNISTVAVNGWANGIVVTNLKMYNCCTGKQENLQYTAFTDLRSPVGKKTKLFIFLIDLFLLVPGLQDCTFRYYSG